MKRAAWLIVRALFAALPAVLLLTLIAPLTGLYLDRRFGWVAGLPGWIAMPGWLLVAAGAFLSVWTFLLLTVAGEGTPNPLLPPVRLVERGPYRVSRNPMMLGAWMLSFGLAMALRSPSCLGVALAIVAGSAAFVLRYEEPGLRRRFGAAYEVYCQRTPRWFHLV